MKKKTLYTILITGDERQDGNQSGEGEPNISWLAVDFDALSEIYPDIVAYLEMGSITHEELFITTKLWIISGTVRKFTSNTFRVYHDALKNAQ